MISKTIAPIVGFFVFEMSSSGIGFEWNTFFALTGPLVLLTPQIFIIIMMSVKFTETDDIPQSLFDEGFLVRKSDASELVKHDNLLKIVSIILLATLALCLLYMKIYAHKK